jgi:peptidyl-prolyl cis-trans isomerase D
MGISTLNSFFTKHHRIIFGVFAILIIIAFVFADWMGGGGGCSMFGGNPGDEQAAEVFGEKFSNRDLNDEARLVQLDNAIYFNGMRMTEEMLKQQAFERLTAKALAKRYNIVISDEDVAQGIFSMPLFIGKDNKFDKETYQKFIDNFLTQQGFTEADLNEVVRHRLLAQKIATVQGSVAPVSEAEVKAFYNTMYQQLDIRMAIINIKDFESKVKVDDKALNEFFNSNRKLFTMPAELDAMVVEFAPAQYMAQVKIDEKEVKDYYEANKDFLTKVKDKDGKEVAPAFEAVKAEITKKLQEAAALKIAQDEAAKFSTEMYDLLNEQEAANRAVAFKTFELSIFLS